MLPVIAFGIIALVIVIFLVSFNAHSLSRAESAKDASSENRGLPTDKSITRSEMDKAQFSERDKVRLEQTSPKKEPGKRLWSDEQYRTTLRQFQAQQSAKSSQVAKVRQSDEEYRSALRSMSKREPRK